MNAPDSDTTTLMGLPHAVFMRVWLAVLACIYAALLVHGSYQGWHQKQLSEQRHEDRLQAYRAENGQTQPQLPAASGSARHVTTGIYVDRITNLSLADAGWDVDFYIWFRWRDADLQPGESFQLIDGEILNREQLSHQQHDGEWHDLYRVQARVTKFFDIARFPRDDHLLTLQVEDRVRPYEDFRYVPDQAGSEVSSRVHVPGYRVAGMSLVEKPHSYRSSRGDPTVDPTHPRTFSQLVAALPISHDGWGFYLKLFQGMYAAVAVAFLGLLLSPTSDSRFDLGIGGFFAAVAATYISITQLPVSGVMTLTDVINGIGMLTVFLTLGHSFLARHLHAQLPDPARVRSFDRMALAIFVLGYLLVNAILPLSASR